MASTPKPGEVAGGEGRLDDVGPERRVAVPGDPLLRPPRRGVGGPGHRRADAGLPRREQRVALLADAQDGPRRGLLGRGEVAEQRRGGVEAVDHVVERGQGRGEHALGDDRAGDQLHLGHEDVRDRGQVAPRVEAAATGLGHALEHLSGALARGHDRQGDAGLGGALAASIMRGSSLNPSVNSTMWRSRALTSFIAAIASSSALTTSVGPSGCSRARASSTTPAPGTCCSGSTHFASALKASTPTVSEGDSASMARATASLVMSVLLTPPSMTSPPMPPANPSWRQWQAAIEPDTSTTRASATDGRRWGSRTRANTGSSSSSGGVVVVAHPERVVAADRHQPVPGVADVGVQGLHARLAEQRGGDVDQDGRVVVEQSVQRRQRGHGAVEQVDRDRRGLQRGGQLVARPLLAARTPAPSADRRPARRRGRRRSRAPPTRPWRSASRSGRCRRCRRPAGR